MYMEAEKLIQVVPSKRQLRHQQLEFYGFFHYSINTYTGREWGDGTESPLLFSPEHPDAEQWVKAIKAAGMKGAILTCKHHDGFCLWPSKYTSHSVAASPYKEGKGDVVREVADACQKEGLKFGIYLSPWDRNQPCYGEGKAYDDYFVHQLTELLTGYGDIFCVWLDGACGEGKNGKVQRYDWERYFEVIRTLQPDACISVCGPDVRWCGNEAGDTRPEEWSVVPKHLCDTERIKELSQQEDQEEFRNRKISSSDLDLGSRNALAGEEELIWYPAEVDVSIRPGWFYHPEEDEQVRSLENLVHIYDTSVGGNAMLLLNVPPAPDGKIREIDVKRLKELGDFIRNRQKDNPLEEPDCQIVELPAASDVGSSVEISWNEKKEISFLVLQEEIRYSQRAEHFEIRDLENGAVLAEGTTIGYKKHISIPPHKTAGIRFCILESRGMPMAKVTGVYGPVFR